MDAVQPDDMQPDDMQPEPARPEVQTRIRDSFNRQGLMRHLGAQLSEVSAGRVQIMLPMRPEITQQDGYIHAGATSAIADSAGGYAALTLFPDSAEVLTIEYKVNLVAPAVGDYLEAVGPFSRRGAGSPSASSKCLPASAPTAPLLPLASRRSSA